MTSLIFLSLGIGLYKSILVTILFCANVCWSLGRASALLGMRMLC